MSEIKHTPGPWSTVEHSWSDTGIMSGFEHICLLDIRGCDEECEVAMGARMAANALLIAAAPELLEALQEVIEARKVYERFGEICPFEGNPMIYAATLLELAEKAEAAIAKATGAA